MRTFAPLLPLLALCLVALARGPAYSWLWWSAHFVAIELLPVAVPLGVLGGAVCVAVGRPWWGAAGLVAAVAALVLLVPVARALADDDVQVSLSRLIGVDSGATVSIERDVALGHDLLADVFRVVGASNQPCVIVTHGGSWARGDKGEVSHASLALARSGAVVVDLRYRLAPEHPFPAGVHDILYAMAAVRGGVVPGVDPDRVVLLGRSAGGHLALLAAAGAAHPDLAPPDLGPQAPPAAVVALYPPVDLAWSWNNLMVPDLTDSRASLTAFVGVGLEGQEARYNQASPNLVAGPDAPPALVLFGEGERVVFPKQAAFVADAWAAQGRPVETAVLPLFDHGFDVRAGSLGAQWAETRTLRFLRAQRILGP